MNFMAFKQKSITTIDILAKINTSRHNSFFVKMKNDYHFKKISSSRTKLVFMVIGGLAKIKETSLPKCQIRGITNPSVVSKKWCALYKSHEFFEMPPHLLRVQ